MALFKKLIASGKHAKFSSLYKAIKEKQVWRQQTQDEIVPWLNDRVQLSSRSIQFEMPGDLRLLEKLTVHTYLSKFCKIPKDRMVVFKRIFKKFKKKEQTFISEKNLVPALMSQVYGCATAEDVDHFLSRLKMKHHDITFDLQTFSWIMALMERILYLSFAEAGGPVPMGLVRTFQESADFECLDWRLKGLNIDPALKKLLYSL